MGDGVKFVFSSDCELKVEVLTSYKVYDWFYEKCRFTVVKICMCTIHIITLIYISFIVKY